MGLAGVILAGDEDLGARRLAIEERNLGPGLAVDGKGDAGPLQELVNRIGAQTATLRRSIDRLWENQSIETCDDWVVPYIGDLLATRLVSCLDARAQRVDVAKTIYYRRRAGTLGLLEELAADIAGRDARAVEFFRRLGRTRHQFDPAIGPVPTFVPGTAPGSAVIQGLAGACSGTPAGGFADLRNAYAAANSAGAFDEYAHTADLRRGGQSSGWHNISHLGVFIWWLQSFAIQGATPVSNGASPPCFSFDPTGRRIPLFAPASRDGSSFGEAWVSPDEWNLPVPVRETLSDSFPSELYGPAFTVGLGAGGTYAAGPASDVRIHPEQGLFSYLAAPPEGEILTTYHFGFSSMIGAGGFDERFFCYCEDIDLALRLRLAGRGSRRVAGAVLLHAGSGTTGRVSEFTLYHGHRNRVWTFLKNTPGGWLWLFLPYHVAANLGALWRYRKSPAWRTIAAAYLAAVRGAGPFLRERRNVSSMRYRDLLPKMAKLPGAFAARGEPRGP